MNVEWCTYICEFVDLCQSHVLQICVKIKQLGGNIKTEKNILIKSVFFLHQIVGKGTSNKEGKLWDCLGEFIPSHRRPPTQKTPPPPSQALYEGHILMLVSEVPWDNLRVDFWFIGHYLWLSRYGRLAHLHVCTALRYWVVR